MWGVGDAPPDAERLSRGFAVETRALPGASLLPITLDSGIAVMRKLWSVRAASRANRHQSTSERAARSGKKDTRQIYSFWIIEH